jgi:transcriptional regulator with XRE-family HTH domain
VATFKEEQIGARIRSLRIDRGLTLAQVAEKTNFSRSYLSKLEHSNTAPPVATLSALADALGVHIADIFAETEPETRVTLIRKNERRNSYRLEADTGYIYTPLAPVFPKRLMDPYVITIPPERTKKQVFQHRGQEIILILKGRLKIFHDNQEFVLSEGDCLYFDASIAHHGHAMDGREVEFLVVMATG